MSCNNEAKKLMHKYLDGDLSHNEQNELRTHLETCEACQAHFHELKRTITLIQGQKSEQIKAPSGFAAGVMDQLPAEKKRYKYMRWFRMHPVLTAAAIFLVLMFGGMFSEWNKDQELVVSKQENLLIEGDTVIVPEGVTVEGDLVIKNGNLEIKGKIDGDVTLINGSLIKQNEPLNGDGLMASVGEINGEFKEIDQVFEWMWYHIKNIAVGVTSIGDPLIKRTPGWHQLNRL
ncbi:Anti-sigma-W factor RsiW [Lentibacillus sp. JNUCC-1]|uniref:zf-HC2 domain-containing protein n=1 Tax=Lentibacillus sp. JNUCC-1 TaxID=2654513 RepID=UPI0012E94451|nr:zf-HC2 domain-containing protein [Lentibacillus sp. JNUCC-1]MUV38201.1 Anti-sigma-W factor RsiW [Lentibacillus sp. JNUCC-1]